MIPKPYLNIRMANAPIALILYLVFNLDFSIILNLLAYSFFSLCCCCCCHHHLHYP